MSDLPRKFVRAALLLLTIGATNPANAQTFLQKVGQAAGNVFSGAVKAGGDTVKAVGHLGGQVVQAGGQIVGSAVSPASPSAGNAIKDGGRRLGNNLQTVTDLTGDTITHIGGEIGHQIEQNPIGVLIAILYPPAAPFVLGAPALAQLVICPVVEHLKSKESCNVTGTLSSLSQLPVATLGEVDMDIAPLTTLFKCLGVEGWLDTGCEGVGSGRPVRAAQLSGDGFWTIDVALDDFQIQGQRGAVGRYIRLEVRPNRPAHGVADHHQFTHDDHICFGGPVLIDKGKWLEVHPWADFGTCPETVASAASGGGETPTPSVPGGDGTHLVRKGECLSTIAQEYYDRQDWPRIYHANRKLIGKHPDLIYPGQHFVIPAP